MVDVPEVVMRPIVLKAVNHSAPSGPLVIEFGPYVPPQNGPGGSSGKIVTGPPPGPHLGLILNVPVTLAERSPLRDAHIEMSVDGTLRATDAAPGVNEEESFTTTPCVIFVKCTPGKPPTEPRQSMVPVTVPFV